MCELFRHKARNLAPRSIMRVISHTENTSTLIRMESHCWPSSQKLMVRPRGRRIGNLLGPRKVWQFSLEKIHWRLSTSEASTLASEAYAPWKRHAATARFRKACKMNASQHWLAVSSHSHWLTQLARIRSAVWHHSVGVCGRALVLKLICALFIYSIIL